MQSPPVLIQMAERKLFRRCGKMTEAVDLPGKGPTLGGIDHDRVQIGTASAGEKETRRMPLELQVLQVVIVPGQIERDIVFAEERVPIADQLRVIAVNAVRINGMVAHRDKVGNRARALQLALYPRELLGMLLLGQREVA